MGDWNQTCGLTHLPILEKDPIAVLPLLSVQNGYMEGGIDAFEDPFAFFFPCAPVIRGLYNGHGGIYDVQDSAAYLRYLERLNEGLDEPVLSLRDFVNFLHKANFWSKRKYSYMVFHQEAFDSVIKLVSERIPANASQEYGRIVRMWVKCMLKCMRSAFPSPDR